MRLGGEGGREKGWWVWRGGGGKVCGCKGFWGGGEVGRVAGWGDSAKRML